MKKYFNLRTRTLLKQLVITEFKLRYQGSVLGYLWSLIKPLLMFGVLYLVFTIVFRLGDSIPNYPTYLLLGIVMWTYFVEATTGGLGSIVGRGDMIRKVSVPKFAIVLATSLSAFVNLILNLLVVFIFMAVTRVDIGFSILYLPIYIIALFILSTAFSFILSALFVKFRDVSYIWEVVLQVLFYATPIIYTLNIIQNVSFQKILLLNPLAYIIQGAREAVITPETITGYELMGWLGILVPLFIAAVLTFMAIVYFKKSSPGFAEYL